MVFETAASQPASLSVGFPFVLSVIVLFIITMMLNPEYLMNKLQFVWKFSEVEKKKKDEGMASWKSGLIHYLIGGFVIPSLFALFAIYFTKNLYLKFIFFILNLIGFNINENMLPLFNAETSVVFSLLMMLFTYVGIWIGVLFSSVFLRFFLLGNKIKLIRWSVFYMFIALIISYYLDKNSQSNGISNYEFNIFDYLVRIVLFYVISSKYFYIFTKELNVLKRYI